MVDSGTWHFFENIMRAAVVALRVDAPYSLDVKTTSDGSLGKDVNN